MNSLYVVSIDLKSRTVVFTYDTDVGGPLRASMPLDAFHKTYSGGGSVDASISACFDAALALRKEAEGSIPSAQGRLDEVMVMVAGKTAEASKLDAEIAAKKAELEKLSQSDAVAVAAVAEVARG